MKGTYCVDAIGHIKFFYIISHHFHFDIGHITLAMTISHYIAMTMLPYSLHATWGLLHEVKRISLLSVPCSTYSVPHHCVALQHVPTLQSWLLLCKVHAPLPSMLVHHNSFHSIGLDLLNIFISISGKGVSLNRKVATLCVFSILWPSM